jgi:hypothetical protein
MAWIKTLGSVMLASLLTGCVAPGVTSTISPDYNNGITATHVLITSEDVPDGQGSLSESEMAKGITELGLTPLIARSGAALPASGNTETHLNMRLTYKTQSDIYVPSEYRPGKTKITTYEKDEKTITEIEETPGYYTDAYTYVLSHVEAAFTLTQTQSIGGLIYKDVVWYADAKLGSKKKPGWVSVMRKMVENAMLQLKWDNVLRPPPEVPLN